MGPVTTEVAAHVGRTCELHGTRNLAVWRDPKIGNIEILRFMDLGKKDFEGPGPIVHLSHPRLQHRMLAKTKAPPRSNPVSCRS